MIHLRNVRKRFGDVQAVDGVTLEVRAGEVLGLLGPNGAGKTTTISMIVGLLKPDSGDVRLAINGQEHDPAGTPAKMHIGIAPQAIALYDELSGRENLEFFGCLFGLAGSALGKRVDECLTLVGLTDRQRHLVKGYSGGMKRRLNLAAAMLHDPAFILMDEPTAGVDPQSRNALFDVVLDLKRRGKTVIYSTHYMEEAERLCDRVAIIDKGRLLALDTVPNLVAQHGGHHLVHIQRSDEAETRAVQSAEPLKVLAEALAIGGVKNARIESPDLETVFLQLTGRRLRD